MGNSTSGGGYNVYRQASLGDFGTVNSEIVLPQASNNTGIAQISLSGNHQHSHDVVTDAHAEGISYSDYIESSILNTTPAPDNTNGATINMNLTNPDGTPDNGTGTVTIHFDESVLVSDSGQGTATNPRLTVRPTINIFTNYGSVITEGSQLKFVDPSGNFSILDPNFVGNQGSYASFTVVVPARPTLALNYSDDFYTSVNGTFGAEGQPEHAQLASTFNWHFSIASNGVNN